MLSHRQVKSLLGRQVYCHTHFGTFKGIIIHTTKHHIILGAVRDAGYPIPAEYPLNYWEYRPFGMGPGPYGPMGPGGPGQPGPGHGGPGWGLAIPLAAILGITAVGMHWW